MHITPNQLKVFKDKYLREGETVSDLINRVANNIALAEALYDPEFWYSKDFTHKLKENKDGSSNVHLIHHKIKSLSERNINHKKFITSLTNYLEKVNPEIKAKYEKSLSKFTEMLSSFKFLPGSPTLMNAGRELQQLSSCFVVDVEDSMDGINHALSSSSIIQKTGGGVGYNFGKIRPKGSTVNSTKGVASGVLSFMKVFNTYTEVIKQGSIRRGALIAVLPYHHPEIIDFINCKQVEGEYSNFNISVGLDDKFFKALEAKESFNFIDPSTGNVVGQYSAVKLFDLLSQNAWKSGDPGIIYLDRINSAQSNTTPHIGNIEAVNPCLTGDMLIYTADSRKFVSIKELAELGKDVSVYCVDLFGKVVARTMRKPRKTGHKNILQIKLADGSIIKVTPDHKCILGDGRIVEAGKLQLGDQLRTVAIQGKFHMVGSLAVSSITELPAEDVYNGTVDEYHNYIIAGKSHTGVVSGINVKNCGELNLLYWESCNLGSINLSKYVIDGKWDVETLTEDIKFAVRFLDNVVEINNYPLEKIEDITKSNRRIGLGIMGWAEALVLRGIGYNTKEALAEADEIMKLVNDTAKEASIHLATERGNFYNWKGSLFDTGVPETSTPMRNCTRTMIAPTGTVSIAAGLQGSGIEPFFGIVYTRYNAKALDALKEGKTPDKADTFFEVNPLFSVFAKKHKYFGLFETDLYKKIDDNHKSLQGIRDIPKEYAQEFAVAQSLFVTAHDIAPEWHIQMQAAFQKHVDCSISKTINMNNSATVDEIKKAYKMSYELGCKGITVYRDGCKSLQVLNLNTKPAQDKKVDKTTMESSYFNVTTGYGPLHIHINHHEGNPEAIFCNIPPIGTEISGLTSLIGVLSSKILELGGNPESIIKHLNSIRGDKPFGFGKNRIESIPHGIAKALGRFIKKEVKPVEDKTTLFCPKCYSSNVSIQAGCSGPTCQDCGYSQCS